MDIFHNAFLKMLYICIFPYRLVYYFSYWFRSLILIIWNLGLLLWICKYFVQVIGALGNIQETWSKDILKLRRNHIRTLFRNFQLRKRSSAHSWFQHLWEWNKHCVFIYILEKDMLETCTSLTVHLKVSFGYTDTSQSNFPSSPNCKLQ